MVKESGTWETDFIAPYAQAWFLLIFLNHTERLGLDTDYKDQSSLLRLKCK